MKFSSSIVLLFGLLIAALTVASQASPVAEEAQPVQFEELEVFGRSGPNGDLVRLKRASCDLFSFSTQWVTPNHAVCAAHCIALGKRGGSCQGTVCHCRA